MSRGHRHASLKQTLPALAFASPDYRGSTMTHCDGGFFDQASLTFAYRVAVANAVIQAI